MVLIFANLGTLNSIWRMRAAMVAGTGGKSRGEIQIGKKISACQIFHPSWSYRCVRACDWKVCLCAVAGFWWNIFSEKYTLTQKK